MQPTELVQFFFLATFQTLRILSAVFSLKLFSDTFWCVCCLTPSSPRRRGRRRLRDWSPGLLRGVSAGWRDHPVRHLSSSLPPRLSRTRAGQSPRGQVELSTLREYLSAPAFFVWFCSASSFIFKRHIYLANPSERKKKTVKSGFVFTCWEHMMNRGFVAASRVSLESWQTQSCPDKDRYLKWSWGCRSIQ